MDTLSVTVVDGTRIAYDVTGSGRGRSRALMLLHGAGKTRRDWHKLGYVERLQDDFTVIPVDVRGTGDSDRLYDIADYGIEKICEDVYGVADACEVQRFAVWGFSFGGNIARYLGAWSDRVTAIAVIGVPFGPAVHAVYRRVSEKVGACDTCGQEGRCTQEQDQRSDSRAGRLLPGYARLAQRRSR